MLKTYQDQLQRTRILAPFDGIVTVITFNDNAYVLPNQALFTIAASDTYVSGLVNEEDVGVLKAGMKAELHLYSAPDKKLHRHHQRDFADRRHQFTLLYQPQRGRETRHAVSLRTDR